METSQFILPGFVFFLILMMLGIGLFKKVIAKLGLRNFYRHKGHAVISIAGLLIGTSIISASMVVGDSIENFIVEETYESLGDVDIIVGPQGEGVFNYSVYTSLASDAEITASTDGLSPILTAGAVARNLNSGQFEPSINLIGFDATLDREFGPFTDMNDTEFYGEDLRAAGSIINRELADKLNANPGDAIMLTYAVGGYSFGGTGQFSSINFTVTYIAQDIGKAIYGLGRQGEMGSAQATALNMFVNLETAQQMFNQTWMINQVKVSNIGDVKRGAMGSVEVAGTIEEYLANVPGAAGLVVKASKQIMLDAAEVFNKLISTFLTIFGSFAIIAGVILIINIFTMLAEERKSELGMARAVGMKRRHLMQSFLYEGLAYGTVAAAIGTLVGVGVGFFLIFLVNDIVDSMNVTLPLTFNWFSLLEAFSIGFLITFATILLTSWRISKLNIIRAIRGIDEPPKDKKNVMLTVLGSLMLALGMLAYYRVPENDYVVLLAPIGMITGLMIVLYRWIGDRVAFSIASFGVLIYCFYAFRTYFADMDSGSGDMLFIISGIFIVLSFVVLVMYNSNLVIRAVTGSFGRIRKFRPTILTGVSYPLTKKFRTGMTVAMFALVIFMIAMLSVFSAIFVVDVEDETLKQGGGFDIKGESQFDIDDIYNRSYSLDPINGSFTLQNSMVNVVQISLAFAPKLIKNNETKPESEPFFEGSLVFGIDDDFVTHTQYSLSQYEDAYANDTEVWNAVLEPGSDKIIISQVMTFFLAYRVGDRVALVNPYNGNLSRNYEIIAVSDQSLFQGILMSKQNVAMNLFVDTNQVFLFDVKEGFNITATADALESELALIGMDTTIVREIAVQAAETTSSMFVLFEIYLNMGMVVGVAGLGVITVRSVVERTPEIGILRSLGFKRKNIRNAFLIEILFVATIGVIIGLTSGILVANEIFNSMASDFGEGIEFLIPWSKIGIVVLIAYVATILCTIIPANNASKIAPAEALRYVG